MRHSLPLGPTAYTQRRLDDTHASPTTIYSHRDDDDTPCADTAKVALTWMMWALAHIRLCTLSPWLLRRGQSVRARHRSSVCECVSAPQEVLINYQQANKKETFLTACSPHH